MRRAGMLGAVLLLGVGCPRPHPLAERPYPPPRPEELLLALRARDRQLHALRGQAKVDHLDGGQRVKFTLSLLVERGGRMRLEAEAPLAGTVATLVSDGDRFALLDTRNNRFLTGPAHACNVARLIHLELEPEQLIEVLMGGVPLAPEARPLGVGWDPEHGGREVLELDTGGGGRARLRFDARDRRWDVVSAEQLDASGQVSWQLTHSDFVDRDGARLPTRTELVQPAIHADVKLRFRELEPNPTAPPGVFQLEPPSGVRAEAVDCP